MGPWGKPGRGLCFDLRYFDEYLTLAGEAEVVAWIPYGFCS